MTLPDALDAAVRAYGAARGLSDDDARAALITIGLRMVAAGQASTAKLNRRLTPEERSTRARAAVLARWAKRRAHMDAAKS